MQLGSAKKWVEALREYAQGECWEQLGYHTKEGTYMDPLGVYLSTVAKDNCEIGWDGVSLTWFGEQFKLTQDTLKRGKFKTDGLEVLPRCPFYALADWIETEYKDI